MSTKSPGMLGLIGGLLVAGSAAGLDVYIIAGQSNADGRAAVADLPADLRQAQPDVPFFYNGGAGGPLDPADRTQFGPEVSFADALIDAGREIAIIKTSKGGTRLDKAWNPDPQPGDAPGTGEWYTNLTQNVAAGLAALEADGHTPRLAGLLWTQGEAEPLQDPDGRFNLVADYADRLDAFAAALRDDLDAPGLPIVVSQLSEDQTAIQALGIDQMQAQQAAFVSNDDHARLVVTDGLVSVSSDNLHFDADGQVALGRLFAQAVTPRVIPEPAGLAALIVAGGVLLRRPRARAARPW